MRDDAVIAASEAAMRAGLAARQQRAAARKRDAALKLQRDEKRKSVAETKQWSAERERLNKRQRDAHAARRAKAIERRELTGFTGRLPHRAHAEILADRVVELEQRVERLHREREQAKRELRRARKRAAEYAAPREEGK